MFIAAELLIFSARAPKYIPFYIAPSAALFCSVMTGNLAVSFMAASFATFGKMNIGDIAIIWGYNIVCLVFMDCMKMYVYNIFEENTEVLPEQEEEEKEKEGVSNAVGDLEAGGGSDIRLSTVSKESKGSIRSKGSKQSERQISRSEHQAERLYEWACSHSDRLSRMSVADRQVCVCAS
jgi:hypothetical protein